MTKLTLKLLEDHQEATINALDKEIAEKDKAIQFLMDQRDVIVACKAKFMTQILMSQTRWKIKENN